MNMTVTVDGNTSPKYKHFSSPLDQRRALAVEELTYNIAY